MKAILYFFFILFVTLSTPPTLIYQNQFKTYHSEAYPNDTCKQLKLTNNYVFRLGSNNVITVYNKGNLNPITNYINSTYQVALNGSIIAPNIINSFDVDQNQTYLTMAQNGSTKFFYLFNFTLKQQWKESIYKIIFGKHVFGMQHSDNGDDKLYKIKYKKLVSGLQLTFSTPPAKSLTNVKNCKCSASPNNTYLVYWDQYSNAYIYYFKNQAAPPTYKAKILSNLITPNLTDSIAFSQDGQYFILQADDKMLLTIISLSPSNFLAKRSVRFKGVIKKAMFLDSSNKYIILFNQTAYTLISTSTLSIVYSRNLSVHTEIVQIDYTTNSIYVCKDNSVDVYNILQYFGNCSAYCQSCISEAICIDCIDSYQLVNDSCIEIVDFDGNSSSSNIAPQSQNNTDASNTSDIVIDANGTNDFTANYTYIYNDTLILSNETNLIDGNNTALIYVMPDGTVIVYQITQNEAMVINKTQQALGHTNKALQKLMVFLTSTPFMFLILGNLQFFSMSSLYIFLNAPIPLDVQKTLKSTFDALNSNLFTTFGLSVNVPQLGRQRIINERYIELGVSTLFLPSNYQYLIISFIVILSMLITKWISALAGCCSGLKGLIQQNEYSTLFGIIASGLPQFILPYIHVLESLWTNDFYDKLNSSIQMIVISFIVILAPIHISYILFSHKANSNKVGKNMHKKQKKQKLFLVILSKQKDNIYYVLINVLFPMLVMISQPLYFFVINQLVLLIGLCISFRCKRQRLNKVILSIYPILFHICFIVFNFTTQMQVIVVTSIICLLVYFLGTIHQFITIFVQFVSFIYRVVKNQLCEQHKISPIADNKPVNKQKEQTIWYFTFKSPPKDQTKNNIKNPKWRSHHKEQTNKAVTFLFVKSNGQVQEHTLRKNGQRRSNRSKFKPNTIGSKAKKNICNAEIHFQNESNCQQILRRTHK